MSTHFDYANDLRFSPDNIYTRHYNAMNLKFGDVFYKQNIREADYEKYLVEAREDLAKFSPARYKQDYGLDKTYFPVKELFAEIMSINAAIIARILFYQGKVDEMKQFLLDFYASVMAEGFVRGKHFLINRLDFHIFQIIEEMLDEEFLNAIGYRHLDRIMVVNGSCLSTALIEKVLENYEFPGIDIVISNVTYRFAKSVLKKLTIAGYFEFIDAPFYFVRYTDRSKESREVLKSRYQYLTKWLTKKEPPVSVFITHAFFGINYEIQHHGMTREICLDAINNLSDEISTHLQTIPNVRCLNFQSLFPDVDDTSVFREATDAASQIHYQISVYDRIAAWMTDVFRNTYQ